MRVRSPVECLRARPVSHSHLSVEEVHRIAFLTMKGWSLVGDEWTKEGFTRLKQHTRGCGCCTDEKETPYFDLESAYWAQSERDR